MIKSILVVGGGSAGWISANLLNAKLNKAGNQKVAITLVESPDIPKIGVGEATVPAIRQTFYDIGLNEWELMRATDATFKTMIRFPDWKKGSYYDHPFDRVLPQESDQNIQGWLTENSQVTDANEFARAFSLLTHLSDRGIAPKSKNMKSFMSPIPYAYHLDAIKLSHHLAEHGQKNGIKHHLANVTNVDVDDAGNIESVRTDTEKTLCADLYIDCTGLKSLLHKQRLGVKTHDFAQYLLCNSAVAMNVSYEKNKPKKLNPFTTAKAMSSGWIWDIPLKNRRGLGYVYSDAFQTSDSAETEFREWEGAHCNDIEVKHIKFKSERSKSTWFGNCVAIGLSGGFLEPLESSGLYLVEFAARKLSELIPYIGESLVPIAKAFNRHMGLIYDEVVEYLNLHYCLSDRDDSDFWHEVRKTEHITPSLRDKLLLWETKPPKMEDFDHHLRLFPVASFEYILFGMGYKPRNLVATKRRMPDITDRIELAASKLPRHSDLINSL